MQGSNNSTWLKRFFLTAFIVLGIASYGFYSHHQVVSDIQSRLENERQSSTNEIAALMRESEANNARISELITANATLESDLRFLQTRVNTTNNSTDPDNPSPSNAPDIDVNILYQQLSTADKADLFDRLNRERMSAPETRLLNAQLALNSMYGDFINSLDLTEDERVELSDYMKIFLAEQFELGQQLQTGEISQEQAMRMNMEYTMRDHLADYLPADELEAFNLYEDTLMARQRSNQIDMISSNMTRMVPGISTEVSKTAAEAIAMEMLGGRPQDAGDGNSFMIRAYERAESVLAAKLDDNAMSQVREFLEIQKQIIRSAEF